MVSVTRLGNFIRHLEMFSCYCLPFAGERKGATKSTDGAHILWSV